MINENNALVCISVNEPWDKYCVGFLDLGRCQISCQRLSFPNGAGLELTPKRIWQTGIKYQFCFRDNGMSRPEMGLRRL